MSLDLAVNKELGQIKVECWAGIIGAKTERMNGRIGKTLDVGVADEKKAKQ